jgi:hypothetical protein
MNGLKNAPIHPTRVVPIIPPYRSISSCSVHFSAPELYTGYFARPSFLSSKAFAKPTATFYQFRTIAHSVNSPLAPDGSSHAARKITRFS